MLKEIHKLPQSTRETLFALSVIVALSLVGIVWVKSFQSNFYALLNTPAPAANDDQLAEERTNNSLFANLKEAFTEMRASLSEVLGSEDDAATDTQEEIVEDKIDAKALPLPNAK